MTIAEAPHHPWQWVVHSAAPSSAWAPLGQHPASETNEGQSLCSGWMNQLGYVSCEVSIHCHPPICQIYSFFFKVFSKGMQPARCCHHHRFCQRELWAAPASSAQQDSKFNQPNPCWHWDVNSWSSGKDLVETSFHCTNRFTRHLLTSANWGLGSDWKPCRALMNGMICKRKAVKLRKWGKYQKCISQAWRSKQRGTLHVVWVNGGFCSSVVLQASQEDHLAFAKQDEEPKWLHCPGRRHSTAQSGFNDFNATLAPDSINSINSITASNSRPSTSLSRLWRSLHMAPNFFLYHWYTLPNSVPDSQLWSEATTPPTSQGWWAITQ